MLFEDKLPDILSTLESGGLLLAPIEFCWAVVYNPSVEEARQQAMTLGTHFYEIPFLLHDSIRMLKKTCPTLHPRVETLLVYHRRPLGIMTDIYWSKNKNLKTKYASCLTFDPYSRHLVSMLGSPVACHYYAPYGRPSKKLSVIDSNVVSRAAYVSKHRTTHELKGIIPVVTSYDQNGLLITD